jgi:antagonist of KipI
VSALLINNAGAQSTLQDEGRVGYLYMGITESGSMDRRSARCANFLCGNQHHEAVIEVTLGGGGGFGAW